MNRIANHSSRALQVQSQRPRECKVCIDAGKSVEEYTAHWVKDREGNITCPTLLNQKCLVCGIFGHTTSYCKMKGRAFLPARNLATLERGRDRPIDARLYKVAPLRPASSNKYALLGLMEQEAQEQEREKLATFPALPELENKPEITRPATTATATATATATSTSTATGAIISWANRLNSPPSPTLLQQQQKPHKPTRPKPVQLSVRWGDQCE